MRSPRKANEAFRALRAPPPPSPARSCVLSRTGAAGRKGGGGALSVPANGEPAAVTVERSQNEPSPAAVSGSEPRAGHHYTTTRSWGFGNSNLQLHTAHPAGQAASPGLLPQDTATFPHFSGTK